MSDKTGIEWTDATWIDPRGRVRTYARQDVTRPGQQLRRDMASRGLRWCRGCTEWLPAATVRSGVCRKHANAEYRAAYASDGRAIKARVHARKRGVTPVPVRGQEALLDQFGGLCAYCSDPAATWDHIVPVVRGGSTEPGNIVPACVSCNSSKKDADVFDWCLRTGRDLTGALDVLLLLEVA